MMVFTPLRSITGVAAAGTALLVLAGLLLGAPAARATAGPGTLTIADTDANPLALSWSTASTQGNTVVICTTSVAYCGPWNYEYQVSVGKTTTADIVNGTTVQDLYFESIPLPTGTYQFAVYDEATLDYTNSVTATVTPATYTITYEPNGAEAGTVPTDPLSPYERGATVTVLNNTGSLFKAGAQFLSWNTRANGTGLDYPPTSTLTLDGNTTLYAQWWEGFVTPTSPPQDAVATAGDAQATVTFDAPAADGGSPVMWYTATADPGGAQATCDGPSPCPITITGLTNGQAYTFTVTAENGLGDSPASNVTNVVTPLAAQSITFSDPGSQLAGSTLALTATSDSGLPVTYSSGTPSVCTVEAPGQVALHLAGTCTLHADQDGRGSFLPAARVTRSFAVTAPAPTPGPAPGPGPSTDPSPPAPGAPLAPSLEGDSPSSLPALPPVPPPSVGAHASEAGVGIPVAQATTPSAVTATGPGWQVAAGPGMPARQAGPRPAVSQDGRVAVYSAAAVGATRRGDVRPRLLLSGTGFLPLAPVTIYLLPGAPLGQLQADIDGGFTASLPVPAGLPAGAVHLQVRGYAPGGGERTVGLPALVVRVGRTLAALERPLSSPAWSLPRTALSRQVPAVHLVVHRRADASAGLLRNARSQARRAGGWFAGVLVRPGGDTPALRVTYLVRAR